ncbi:hypothetical protein LINGRAHAP2_LOCUS10987 [Linum grandiflorum]
MSTVPELSSASRCLRARSIGEFFLVPNLNSVRVSDVC